MSKEGLRVLLVESNDDDRRQFKAALADAASDLGFDVAEAGTGKQGVGECRTTPPACAVFSDRTTDMEMASFIEELGKVAGDEAPPVIVILSRRSRKALNEAESSGAADWVFKDQVGAELGDKIRTVLEQQGVGKAQKGPAKSKTKSKDTKSAATDTAAEDVQAKLADAEARAAEAEARVAEAESRIADAEARAAQAEGAVAETEARAAQAEDQVKKTEARVAEAGAAQAEAGQAQAKVADAEARAAQAETRAAEAEARAAQAEAEVKKAQARATEAGAAQAEAGEAQKKAAEARASEAEARATRAEAQAAEAETRATAAETRAAESEARATQAEAAVMATVGAAGTKGEGQQQALLRALLTGVPGLLALKNTKLQYEAANPAFCQFVGKSPDEILGASDTDLFSKKDAKTLQAGDKTTVESGMQRTEVEEVGVHGGNRWIEITRNPLVNDDGETTGLLWSARDITSFKQMEDAVRQNEESFRVFAEDQTELACRLRPDGTLTFVNEPVCVFFGKPRESVMGQNFSALLPQDGREAMQKHLASLGKKNPVADIEVTAAPAKGGMCLLRWTTRALFAADGSLEMYQAVGRDVTEHRRIEKELAERAGRLGELEKRVSESDGRVAEVERQFQEKAAQLEGQVAEAERRAAEAEQHSQQKTAQLEQQLAGIQGQAVKTEQEFQQKVAQLEQRAAEADGQVAEREAILKDKTAQFEQYKAETEGRLAEAHTHLTEKDAQLQQVGDRVNELERRVQDAALQLTETLNLVPIPFCELGAGTRIVFINQAGLDVFQYSQEEVDGGIDLVDLFHPDDRNRAAEAIQAAIEGKAAEPGEYRMRCKDGSETSVQLVCAPILQDGRVAGVRCCLVDLVDRQAMEEAFGTVSRMMGAAAHAASLSKSVNDLIVASFEDMIQSDAEPSGPDSTKLEELQGVLQKVSAFVQQMRAGME